MVLYAQRSAMQCAKQAARGPDFFIVGAPKSGTTALGAYLGAHPNIFMPKKDMHMFGSDLAWGPMFTRRTWDEYLGAFSAASDAMRVGESSPGYLVSELAAQEIKSYRPDAQIVATLRNPIEVIHSLHSHSLYMGDEDIEDLEQALLAAPARRAGRRIPRSNTGIWAVLYRDVVRYRPQLERYLQAFGRDRVHVIIYDDFKERTAATYRGILEFLGVEPEFEPEFEILNPSKRARIRAISAAQNTPAVLTSGIWKLARQTARRTIPSHEARMRLYRWVERKNTVYERQAPIPAELRKRLEAELADEVSKLGALLGRDLSHWVGGSR
jgi:Sulfotransferase domain